MNSLNLRSSTTVSFYIMLGVLKNRTSVLLFTKIAYCIALSHGTILDNNSKTAFITLKFDLSLPNIDQSELEVMHLLNVIFMNLLGVFAIVSHYLRFSLLTLL